jgi:hypothetical protein
MRAHLHALYEPAVFPSIAFAAQDGAQVRSGWSTAEGWAVAWRARNRCDAGGVDEPPPKATAVIIVRTARRDQTERVGQSAEILGATLRTSKAGQDAQVGSFG